MRDWRKVKLGQLLTESRIESRFPKTSRRVRVKLNVAGVDKRPDTNDKPGATKYYSRKAGQFIYGRQNLHKGAFGIVPKELDGFESSADIPAFDVDESCYPKWIYYFFKQGNFYLELEALAKGVGSKRVHPKKLYELLIPLPSKRQQKEILDNIDAFEDKHQLLSNEIKLQLDLIEQLRKSILQEAVEGKLTAGWRKENPNLKPASELLKRIGSGKNRLIKRKKPKKEKPLLSVTEAEIPHDLPKGWVWSRLGDLIQEKPRNGISPKGVNYKTKVKSLKLSATTKGFFDRNEFKYLAEDFPENSYLWLKPGDILIQRSNSINYVGVSAIYDGGMNEFVYSDLMMKIHPVSPITSEYIHQVLNSPMTRNYYRKNATGTSGTMPKINQRIVLNTLIPFPPISEQKLMVNQLNSLMNLCNDLEQQVQQGKTDIGHLMESVLSEVFGEENKTLGTFNQRGMKLKEDPTVQQQGYIVINEVETLNMELIELLDTNSKMQAVSLWKMSKYKDDIDAFYDALKQEVEVKMRIKESTEKGFLELVK